MWSGQWGPENKNENNKPLRGVAKCGPKNKK